MTSARPACSAIAATFDLIAAKSTMASDCPSMDLSVPAAGHQPARSRRGSAAWLGTSMVELIPRKVLFGNPERISPRLSPDGTRLAWIAPSDGVLNVWLAPVSPQTGVDWDKAEVVTDDTDRGIRQFAWAHDNKHLMYLQDTGGDENWRLHDVDLSTMQRRDLTPFDGVQTQIVAIERDFPSDVLIGMNRDNPQLHDVYRLDLVSGELVKEVENPGFLGWVADAEMVVRCGIAPQPDGGMVVMIRDDPGQDWRPL